MKFKLNQNLMSSISSKQDSAGWV